MGRLRWVGVAGGLALVALGVKAARTYQCEASQFYGRNAPVPRPDDLTGLDGLLDVTFTSDAGDLIHAWYIPSKNRAAIVMAHGSPATRADLVPEARALGAAGYGALLFDFPGHGESGGSATWGAPAEAALRGAVTFVAARPEVDPHRIGALGFSMGSYVLSFVAAQDTRIAAMIFEGAFTDFAEQLAYEFRAWGPITRLPAIWAARNAVTVSAMRPLDVIDRIAPRPVLFVAGSDDPVVPPEMSRALFARAGEPKTLHVVPHALHGHYGEVEGKPYFDLVVAFFRKNLDERLSRSAP